MKVIFFIFVYLTTSYTFSQSTVIRGRVIDANTGSALFNTNLFFIKNGIGAITNEKGLFKVMLNIFPDTVRVSFIGYKTCYLPVNKNDTILTFFLHLDSTMLKEIIVKSIPDVYNSDNQNYTVLDYGFIDGNILVLLEKTGLIRKNKTLVLLDNDFDTLIYNNNLPGRSYGLFEDCLNNMHILTNDSAYQLAFYDKKIVLFSPVEIHKFFNILSDCLFKINDEIFFRQKLFRGFAERIYHVNENDHKKSVLLNCFDTIRFNKFTTDIRDISSLYRGHSTPITSVENDSLLFNNIHKYEHYSRYLFEFSDKPVQNQIFNCNDTIVYFNNTVKKIEIFLSNGEQSEYIMPYKEHKDFPPKILFDKIYKRFYAVFKGAYYYKFYKVELFDDSLKYCFKIPKYFTDDFKINNGYVYFLSNKILTNTQNKKIARLDLLCK